MLSEQPIGQVKQLVGPGDLHRAVALQQGPSSKAGRSANNHVSLLLSRQHLLAWSLDVGYIQQLPLSVVRPSAVILSECYLRLRPRVCCRSCSLCTLVTLVKQNEGVAKKHVYTRTTFSTLQTNIIVCNLCAQCHSL